VAQWTANGIPVAPTLNGSQTTPAIIYSSDGSVVIVWADTRNGALNSDIYAQRLDPSGAPLWAAEGIPLCAAAGNQTAPIVAPSLDGAVMVAWLDNRVSSNTDLFAQRITADGLIQWPTNGIGVTAASGIQSAPRMTSDGGRGAILAWQDGRTADSDIYAMRIAPNTVLDVAKPARRSFSLAMGSSNPARGEARLVLELERAAAVTVDVFDAQGRRVSRLLEGTQESGRHDVTWRARDTRGATCKAGIYLVRARSSAEEATLKVTLAR
jgi:flagellar hook capping protein FlgD